MRSEVREFGAQTGPLLAGLVEREPGAAFPGDDGEEVRGERAAALLAVPKQCSMSDLAVNVFAVNVLAVFPLPPSSI